MSIDNENGKVVDLASFRLKKQVEAQLDKEIGEPKTEVPSSSEIGEVLDMLGLLDSELSKNLIKKGEESEFCHRRRGQLIEEYYGKKK